MPAPRRPFTGAWIETNVSFGVDAALSMSPLHGGVD